MKKKNMLLVIDGNSLMNNQFFATARFLQGTEKKSKEEMQELYKKIMQTTDGVYTNAIYGTLSFLLDLVNDINPSHMIVVWDLTRNTFRRSINPTYKGTRSETHVPLREQFGPMREILKDIGIRQIISDGTKPITEIYEADDYAGSIANTFKSQIPIVLLSKDKDYFQLVSENVRLWYLTQMSNAQSLREKYYDEEICKMDLKHEMPNSVFEFTPPLVKEYLGVAPEHAIDLKALVGDTGDNISGVYRVGDKMAIPLINEYKNIENLYEHISCLSEEEEKELKDFWKNSLGMSRTPIEELLKGDLNRTFRNDLRAVNKAIKKSKYGFIKNLTSLDELVSKLIATRINDANYEEILSKVHSSIKLLIPTLNTKVSELTQTEPTSEYISIITDFVSVIEKYLAGEATVEKTAKECAYESKILGTIKTDIEIPYTLEDLIVNIDQDKLEENCVRYEFKSILKKMGKNFAETLTDNIIDNLNDENVDDIVKEMPLESFSNKEDEDTVNDCSGQLTFF